MKSRFIVMALSLILMLSSYASVNAQEEANKPAPAAAAAEEAIPDVPQNGTLEDYQDYISNLKELFQKKAKSMFEQAQKDGVSPESKEFLDSVKSTTVEFISRVEKAVDKAMLLKDVSDDDFEALVKDKLQAIQGLAQFNDEDEAAVNAKMEAFVAQLRKMDKTKLADAIEAKLLEEKIRGYVMKGNVEAFTKVASEIDEKVEKAGKDISLTLARQAAITLLAGASLPGYKAPEGRQDNYIKVLSEATDPEVQKLAAVLERAVLRAEGEKRFKESLGKEFKFGGTFTDGSEYKAEDYAGKVVLIDFWATWCGPCRRELPNVKKMYDAYHDKGFEVIGVTCDDPDNEEVLNKFLKDNDIAWKQMFDEKAVVPGLKTKDDKAILVSEYYGINGIPCPILIGTDGKVVSLNARGEELKKQLVQIYGEVKEEAPADDEDQKPAADTDEESDDIFADEDDEPAATDDEPADEDDAEDLDAEDEPQADAEDEAADEAIPDVPENGTFADYKKYIEKLNDILNKKAKSLIAKAQKGGINPQSEEFAKSLKALANDFFPRIEKAADKAMILKEVSDEQFEELLAAKIQVIQVMAKINEEDEDVVLAKLETLAAQLRKMDKAKFADELDANLFQNKVIGYALKGDVKSFAKAAAEIDEKVEKAGKDITPALGKQAILIIMVSSELKGYEAPEGRLDKYTKALTEAADPEVNKLADDLEELLLRAEAEKRFNDSLGKEFEFGGTFTDGSEYNAKDYAGKVVLIDFWATWCGPCRAELPNVKKLYAAYHDKGFEVIGVTCDDPEEEEDFNKFLKDNDITWKQMYDDKAVVPGQKDKDGKPVQVSTYYGISGIPCPILIGTDGKVLSLNARGEELEEQLVKIYGEVKEEPAAEDEK